MTDEDNIRKMNSIIQSLERESREVDSLIARLSQKKAEIQHLINSIRINNAGNGDTLGALEKSVTEDARIPDPKRDDENLISAGNEKLDALLLGGVSTPSNVVLRGPPFSGKFIIENCFIAQSVKDGIPVVVLTADKDIVQMKRSLSRIVEGVEEAEKNGLIRFIDAYSKSIQANVGSPHAIQVDPSNLSALIKTLDSVTAEVHQDHGVYRFLLTSLTTFIPQFEESKFLRLLQQVTQKRRTENAVSVYALEDGLFDERVYEAVSYLMDGAIHLRKTFSSNYLRVEGLGKSRSREWIELYPGETGFDLGPFTLERVR